jgi:23S rRNA pseudouridine2605 synthase
MDLVSRQTVVKLNPERRVGLARALSRLGICSRSQAAALIRAGRVKLNGSVRRDPETPVREGRDRIAVDEKAAVAQEKIYVMLNKPRGLVTSVSDEQGRATVYSALSGPLDAPTWVAPIGRLDKASEGLLLMTNDSVWGARITAPERHLEKTYHVQIDVVLDDNSLKRLIDGVKSDGELLRARRVHLLRAGKKNCWLEIVLDEGKYRQIRRMVSALGAEVLRLVRIAVGPLQLGKLAKGSHRQLTAEEKLALDRAMNETRA